MYRCLVEVPHAPSLLPKDAMASTVCLQLSVMPLLLAGGCSLLTHAVMHCWDHSAVVCVISLQCMMAKKCVGCARLMHELHCSQHSMVVCMKSKLCIQSMQTSSTEHQDHVVTGASSSHFKLKLERL